MARELVAGDAAQQRGAGTAGLGDEIVLQGRSVEDGGWIRTTVRGGIVTEVVRPTSGSGSDYVGPGWLDIQINGFDGHDPGAADADADVVIAMIRSLWPFGVTAACVTICTESEARIVGSLGAIAQACESDPIINAAIVGIHVEGPHIARDDGPRGAHPLEHVRPPDLLEYRRWQVAAGGRIRVITLSPEYDEALPYIRAVVADGVVASIGHTAATSDQIRAAVDAGARLSTHLGNGAHELLRRHPNYIWDQLAEDRLSAGFIFDGQHLPPEVMRTVLRAKGIERSILVSDAVAVAGLAPGKYTLSNGLGVELLPSGRLALQGTPFLAGAVAALPVCIANAVRCAGVTLTEAVRMVTTNPSRLLGLSISDGHESIRTGMAANMTVFRQLPDSLELEIRRTIVSGNVVYDAERA